MRLILFFDLPVNNKEDRKNAAAFRKLLLREGFIMLQFSVYMKVCWGPADTENEINKIKKFVPPRGSIRALSITEKQYGNMYFLLGNIEKTEKIQGDQLVLF